MIVPCSDIESQLIFHFGEPAFWQMDGHVEQPSLKAKLNGQKENLAFFATIWLGLKRGLLYMTTHLPECRLSEMKINGNKFYDKFNLNFEWS